MCNAWPRCARSGVDAHIAAAPPQLAGGGTYVCSRGRLFPACCACGRLSATVLMTVKMITRPWNTIQTIMLGYTAAPGCGMYSTLYELGMAAWIHTAATPLHTETVQPPVLCTASTDHMSPLFIIVHQPCPHVTWLITCQVCAQG